MKLLPVILSGGSGTRLWPLSREKYPKQLLNLFNERSMLQETALRLKDFRHKNIEIMEDPVIVSNKEYRFLIAEQLKQVGVDSKIILEPCGKNTAPALSLAALKIIQDIDDAIMLVMPADHLIENVDEFHQAIAIGLQQAKNGGVVCFGIDPTRADTGYGYIKTKTIDSPDIRLLDSFVEKPNAAKAKEYFDSKDFVWNSGIFMLKASLWIELISKMNCDIYESCKKAIDLAECDRDFIWVDAESFAQSPSDSIDYAVMEHIGKKNNYQVMSYVVPMSVGWSDVGAWDAVWDASEKDGYGNVSNNYKETHFCNSQNNLVISDTSRLVTLLGLKEVVIIDTQDALLIADKNKLAEIKDLVSMVKESHPELTQLGRKVFRPWGSYDSVDSGENFQVKRIVVNPGETLSLQMHYHRAEHWIVVKGTGRITKDKETFLLHENQSVYIPLGTVHRLENPGKFALELIEVQSGNYLGEDDIVRFEDVYGRTK